MGRQILEYDEFEVRLVGSADTYRVSVRSAVGAEAAGEFKLPFSAEGLELLRMTLDPSTRQVRGRAVQDVDRARAFGTELLKALVIDERVHDVYRLARRDAEAAGRGLRVTLHLSGAPQLTGIPWELLYERPRFLAQSIWTPVVRYLDLPPSRPPLRITPPLRILGMVSRPIDDDLQELDAEQEQGKLGEALRSLIEADLVELRWLKRATLRAIQHEIAHGGDFHVFHYVGHGEYDERSGQSSLVLERHDRRAERVTGERLGTMLADRRTLRLAVLNACEAAKTAPQDPLAGVAASLLQWDIPAVIGMQFAITDESAITFAEEFYTTLAEGYPVDASITEARRALAACSDLEWGTPVLFMRVADGRLFDVEAVSDRLAPDSEPAAPDVPAEPAERERPAQAERDRVERVTSAREVRRRLSAALAAAWSRRRLRAGVAAIAVLAAVAILAYVLVSDGSDEWTQVNAGASVLDGSGLQKIQSVAKLPQGRAVAVGMNGDNPAVWTFYGSSWFRPDLSAGRGVMNAVVLAEGKIFAVGSRPDDFGQSDAVAWLRLGGGEWRSVLCDACGGRGRQVAFSAIARRNGGFVAVGYAQGGPHDFDAAVWQSSDHGESWTRSAKDDPDLAGENSQLMQDVVELRDRKLGDRLVAVGRDGSDAAVWTSPDGLEWARVSASNLPASPGFLAMSSVTTIGTRLVAVGWEQPGGGLREGAAWISYDHGSTWKRGSGDFAARGQQMLDVTAVPPELVAVGNDRPSGPTAAVWSSVDGLTWTAVRSGAFASDDKVGMTSAALLDNGILLGVGNRGGDAAIWESKAH